LADIGRKASATGEGAQHSSVNTVPVPRAFQLGL